VNITIRPELARDYRGCEELVRDAFWDIYRPGCVEHLIVHQSRTSPDLVLDLVAEAEGQLLGCLIATRARVVSATGAFNEVLYLGPLAVHVDHQGLGIGSRLVSYGLDQATQRGFSAAFLYGDPGYYERFGFRDAANWSVTTPDGLNFDAFMGTELRGDGLAGICGRLLESPSFEVDTDRLLSFEATFAYREQHVLPGQLA
jgi:predicted N-acetyltransferase YhbS